MRAILRWLFGRSVQGVERRPPGQVMADRTQETATQSLHMIVSPDEKPLEVISPAIALSPVEVFTSKRRLRELDVDIALEFWFFSSAEFSSRWDLSPKGFIFEEYGKISSGFDRKRPVAIPHYSTSTKDFLVLEARVKSWHADLYILNLREQEVDEVSATLEQKCRAALQAARLRPRDRRAQENPTDRVDV